MTDLPVPLKLTAVGWIRAIGQGQGEAGGSEAHILETSDGHFVTKVENNPQGPRVLPNELVGALCLEYLGVLHPPCALLDVPPEVITDSPGAAFRGGQRLQSGLAIASEYWQSDPDGTVDAALVGNPQDRIGARLLDAWIGQHDGRQGRVRPFTEHPGKYLYFPVDQGHSVCGPDWTPEGLDASRQVQLPDIPDADAGIARGFAERLRSFSTEHATHIVLQIPAGWLDEARRGALVRYLTDRAALIAEAIDGKCGKEGG